MPANNQTIIATAAVVSVGVGSANSVFKYKKPPATRFLIGSGVAFLLLSAMANSDTLGEIAKGLALGIMSTILLGDGGGVLSYFAGEAEMNTKKPNGGTQTDPAQREAVQTPGGGKTNSRSIALIPVVGNAAPYHR